MTACTTEFGILPKRRELPSRMAVDELMVTDPDSGDVHFLNGTASVVWDCCDGKTAEIECIRRIRLEFEVDQSVDLSSDVSNVVRFLWSKGLLED